ncbi:MAG: cytochrome c [Ferruginibacter sp.]
MKRLSVIFLGAVCLTACHKKGMPMTSTTKETPKETVTTITPTAPVVETGRLNMALLASGQKVYEGNCAKCHELKEPADYTQDRWRGIVNWMAPKAKLDSMQKVQVLAYVQHNAKDAPKDKANM